MKQYFKIGAAAMALALSVTVVAPITANAESYYKWEIDANGNRIYTYVNEDTKESLSQRDYDILNPGVIDSELKTKTITTNSYHETAEFTTTKDVARFENFKSKNKDLQIKIINKVEKRDLGEEQCTPDYMSKDGQTWYYKNIDGKIITVNASRAATDMPKGNNSSYYVIRLYTTKAGTYKVSYDAILKNGGKVKKTFKVIAKEDGNPIKSLTYGGLDVMASASKDKDPGNSVWAKGFGYGVTTKKSGAIKVVMNPDFKLKKLEVGTPSIRYLPVDETTQEMAMAYTDAYSSLDRYYPPNDQDAKTISWKKVKNGKKIKLSTVDEGDVNKLYLKGWEFGKKSETTYTYIRVTYYDKKNKETRRAVFPIQLVQE